MTKEELIIKAKPILFKTDEVGAILDGRKTQMRQPIKPQPRQGMEIKYNQRRKDFNEYSENPLADPICNSPWGTGRIPKYKIGDILYVRESINMQKKSARIFLMVTDVRAKKLQDMCGREFALEGGKYNPPHPLYLAFKPLWDKKYAKKGFGWDSNPWVFVFEFEVVNL